MFYKLFNFKRLILTLGVVIVSSSSVKWLNENNKDVLRVYSWFHLISPELISEFEKQNNCTVIVDFFDSNESMFAKILSKREGYDILLASDYSVDQLIDANVISKLNRKELSNLKHIDYNLLEALNFEDTLDYSIPYSISYSCVAYRKDKVDIKPSQRNWDIFLDKRYTKRMTMYSDLREVIGSALLSLGKDNNSINKEDLELAKQKCISWKNNIAAYVSDFIPGLESGEFFISHAYTSCVYRMQSQSNKIGFFFPIEGFTVCSENFCIIESSKQKKLCHKFLNFMLSDKSCATNELYNFGISVNKNCAKLLPERALHNHMIVKHPKVIRLARKISRLNRKESKLYFQVWDTILST